MTIGVIFQYGNEKIEVRVRGKECLFRTSQQGYFVTIDNLKLDKKGVIKEFPDLKDNDDWKQEAVKRFKQNLNEMETEKERIQYVIIDLSKYGYKPLIYQQQGFRPKRLS